MRKFFSILPFFTKRRTVIDDCSYRTNRERAPLTVNDGTGQSAASRQMEEGTGRFTVLDVNLTADGAAVSRISPPAAAQHDEPDSSETIPPMFVAIKTGDVRGMREILAVDPEAANTPKYGGFPPLHAACNAKNLQALMELLNNGAKVGAVAGLGHTALHLAVSEGWQEGVAELLQRGASPDAMLEPPPTVKGVHMETPLHSAVRRGDLNSTVIMLQYQPDLAVRDSDNCSVFHLAAQSHSLEIIRQLLKEKLPAEVMTVGDRDNNSALHKALLRDCDAAEEVTVYEIVEELVKAGAKVNSVNNRRESPLFFAAHQRLPKLVELLLRHGADPTLITRGGQSVLHAACHQGCATCLGHLLDTKLVTHLVTAPDNEGREPFHYAVHSGSIDCCELLLNNGDHLTRLDKDGISRCSLVLEHLPSAPQLLRRLFDAHVRLSNKPQHDADFRVTFDYSVLSSEKEGIQSSLISELSNSRLEALLKHPLLESFLFIKWRKIKPFFYCSVLIYFLFLMIHTVFIAMTYGSDPWNWREKWNTLVIFLFLHVTMFLLILIPDLIIMFANFKKYLRQWETLTKTIALGSSAIVVFSYLLPFDNVVEVSRSSEATGVTADNVMVLNYSQDRPFHEVPVGNISKSRMEKPFVRHAAALSAFFCWVEFMMLLGRFPSLGTYVLMFSRVAQSIIKFIMAFFSLIVGFAISFMVLFHNKEAFKTLPLSLVKTLTMMIGEIDYNSLLDGLEMPVMSCLFLILFLFLVCVLMANLLIGLAVNDIPDLQRQGKIKRLSKQASYLVSYEKLMIIARNLGCFPRQLRILMSSRCRIPQVVNVLPNKHRRSSHKKLDQYVPSETLQEAILLGNCEDPNEDLNNIGDDLLAQFKSFKSKYTRDRRLIHRRLAQLSDGAATEKILNERLDQMQQMIQTQLMQLILQLQQQSQSCNSYQHLLSVQQQQGIAQLQQVQQHASLAGDGGQAGVDGQGNVRSVVQEYSPHCQQHHLLSQLSLPQQSVQTQSVSHQCIQTQSVSHQCVQTQSVPQQPVQTQSVPQQSVQTQSMSQQSVQTQSVPQQSVQTQSVPQQSVHTQSVPQQPVQTQSVPQQPVHTQSLPQQSVHTQSVPQQSVHTQSVPQQSVHTQSVPQQSVHTQSAQTQSVPQQPAHTQSLAQQSVHTQSVPQQSVHTQSLPQQAVRKDNVLQQHVHQSQQSVLGQSVPKESVRRESVPQSSGQSDYRARHIHQSAHPHAVGQESVLLPSVQTQLPPQQSLQTQSISQQSHLIQSEQQQQQSVQMQQEPYIQHSQQRQRQSLP